MPGCLWVLVSAFLPVVMILTVVYLHAVNPRLEEAGRLIARWPAVLRHITLPMILPGILFGGILVFLLALGEVGVPMFLRYPVFPVETLTQFSAFYDFGAAAAAATPLLAITLLVLALERRYLREKTYRLRPTTPGRRMLLIPLGRWRVPALLAVSLLAAADRRAAVARSGRCLLYRHSPIWRHGPRRPIAWGAAWSSRASARRCSR